jgi:uncharacterized damage-inducible protein DinB
MVPAISLEELLAWNEESAGFWKAHLDANPALLELPCGVAGTATVHEFVRHIWRVELRWAQRIIGEPQFDMKGPLAPVEVYFDQHRQAMSIFRTLLDDPAHNWDAIYTLNVDWLPAKFRNMSHRKLVAHTLFHSQRHWAQLSTLVRVAGYPSGFHGDLLFSSGIR